MRTKLIIAATATTLVVVGLVHVVSAAPAARYGKHFTVVTHTTKDQPGYQRNPMASPDAAPSPGDTFLDVHDILSNGKKVGTGRVVCTAQPDDAVVCNAVYTITGQGDLTLAGAVSGSNQRDFYVAVTGGTQAFRGARGDDHITEINDTDSRETFTLM